MSVDTGIGYAQFILIDNGSSVELGFRFHHETVIDAISGVETQIEMAVKALEHQLRESSK